MRENRSWELRKFLEIFILQGSHFFIVLDSRAGAKQISVTVDIVNTIDAWPEFGINRSSHRIYTLGLGIRPLPVVI